MLFRVFSPTEKDKSPVEIVGSRAIFFDIFAHPLRAYCLANCLSAVLCIEKLDYFDPTSPELIGVAVQ
jgi:hypothetical protein